MESGIAVVALFAIAASVALIARWARVPYTVALVVAGLGLNALHMLQPPHLTKELLYTLFLPGLVFEAAFALDLRRFFQSKWLIAGLALPGLCAAIAVTALVFVGVSKLAGGTGLATGGVLVFAALISATDPIAVVALFKQLGAPKRLAVLVESESLLNDGTAAIVFTLVVESVLGATTSITESLGHFALVVGMGALVGAAFGGLSSLVMRWVDDGMIETTLTTIAAYGSFVVAEHFRFSGILATVVAGVICGTVGAQSNMSASTRIAVASFWEYLAFALNSLVFLLIGFEVRIHNVLASFGVVLVAYLAVTVGRVVVVGAGTLLTRRSSERIAWTWAVIVGWGGLRGALSMVLALGLPEALPGRETIIDMTFGVVTLSILLQGTTMGTLLRRLGVVRAEHGGEHQLAAAELRAAKAAAKELASMASEGDVPEALASELTATLEARVAASTAVIDAHRATANEVRAAEREAALRRLARVEKAAIAAALRAGEITEEAHTEIKRQIDARIVELRDHED